MPMDRIIYLDNASTSKVNPEVLESFNQITLKYFANPSSIHRLGQESNRLLEKSREQILSLLNLNHHDVIFTSGPVHHHPGTQFLHGDGAGLPLGGVRGRLQDPQGPDGPSQLRRDDDL